jgi:hypothetical protein
MRASDAVFMPVSSVFFDLVGAVTMAAALSYSSSDRLNH